MPKRGRLAGSVVRDNIVEILHALGKPVHGYEISKLYSKVFNKPISTRLVYYHLKKGKELGVFESQGIQKVTGDYSWGSVVERKMFKLGNKAEPRGLESVKNKVRHA